MRGRILVVDDERAMVDMMRLDLEKRGFGVSGFTNAEDAFESLRTQSFDVVVTDIKMPGMDGIALCERVAANFPDTLVIVTTAFGSIDTAVAAMRAGAFDFVTKPFDMDVMTLTLERAIKHMALKQQVKYLSQVKNVNGQFGKLTGCSKAMQQVFDHIKRLASSDAAILITGESGTGKGLAAHAIHESSTRNKGPFVVVNCAALPESLLESELFGHVRGAFTDARAAHRGFFQEAHGGTLFLDEIGELPLRLQPKLLRALEEKKIRPVGGEVDIDIDVRVIAATNRDLESEVNERNFREDLYFRISVVPIEMPPLRSRMMDIPLLAKIFLEEFAFKNGKDIIGFTQQTMEKLLRYNWPGNVRELRNTIERAVALSQTNQIIVEDLPQKIRAYETDVFRIDGQSPHELLPLQEMERRYILHVLKVLGGNRTLTAKTLGLDRKTLYRKLRHYELNRYN